MPRHIPDSEPARSGSTRLPTVSNRLFPLTKMDLVIMHIEYANIVLIDQIAVDEYRTLHRTSLLFLSRVSTRGREYSGMLFVLKATQMLKKV